MARPRWVCRRPDAAEFRPQAQTAVRGPGRHTIMFANVDDELRLWVDGRVAEFDAATTYDSFALGARMPTEADLSPAGIAVRKAAAKVSHLKLSRDIYYIADEMQRERSERFQRRPAGAGRSRHLAFGFADDNMRRVDVPAGAARIPPIPSRTSSSSWATTAPRARTAACGGGSIDLGSPASC